MIEMSQKEYEKLDPTEKMVRHSPCSFCGRKSTARLRFPVINGTFHYVGFCDDHMSLILRYFKEKDND